MTTETETTERPSPDNGGVAPASRISPLSIETARRMLGEASADIAVYEAKLIECEATRTKLIAAHDAASRRLVKAREALTQLHRDEPLSGPAPRAVDNGHLVGA